MKIKICFLIASLLLFLSSPAIAKTDYLSSEIESLKKRLYALEQEAQKQKDDPNRIITSLKPAPSFRSADGRKSFEIDGRIMVDAGMVTKDKNSGIHNTISIRRFWLGVSGKADKDWSYRGLVGFENNKTSVYDVFVNYHGFENADLRIGNFFENNGIDVETPNLISSFMERSSGITTFRELRRTGVSYNPHGQNWGAKLGFFGSTTNNSSTNAKGYGFSGRFYALPIKSDNENHFLHFGFNTSLRTPDSATKAMRFSSFGNTNVLNQTLIDTGNITNVNSYYQYSPEIRYQNGSLTLTGEYIETIINRDNGFSNLKFNGSYVMASYFLTKESYGYDVASGTPIAANITKNAWEIAARYSDTNLNNKTIKGGRISSYDFGINFYPNNRSRIMLNYIFNRLDNSAQIQKNPQYLMLRMQVNF